jgi:hypothetical protein
MRLLRTRKSATNKQVKQLLAEAMKVLEDPVRCCTRPGPGLLRISQLAHASWSDLQHLADIREFADSWEGATSYLASAIRSQAGSADGLLALQRNGLMPLEANMLTECTLPPVTPSELIAVTCREVHATATEL